MNLESDTLLPDTPRPSLLTLSPELVAAFSRFIPTISLARLQIAVCGDLHSQKSLLRGAIVDLVRVLNDLFRCRRELTVAQQA
jgi:hypothetical protein